MDCAVTINTSSGTEPVPGTDSARCSSCAMRRICVSHDVDRNILSQLETLIHRAKKLRRGETVYFGGHTLHYLYAIRSGSVKTVIRNMNGDEQIVGVHGPGDAVGLDAMAAGEYVFDAIAIEDSSVCLIPYDMLKQLCRDVPVIQQRMAEILGEHVVRNALLKALCNLQPVEARVIAFLMECSRHSARRGFSAHDFHLGMTRAEIGNYLCAAMETVSRVMSMTAHEGLIEVKRRHIHVPDLDKLERRLLAALDRATHDVPGALILRQMDRQTLSAA